jgi:hypothetical protein
MAFERLSCKSGADAGLRLQERHPDPILLAGFGLILRGDDDGCLE